MWASLRYLISNEQGTVYLISVKYVNKEEKWRLILDISLSCESSEFDVEEHSVFLIIHMDFAANLG